MNDWQVEQNEIRGRIQRLFLFLLFGYLLMGAGTMWWGILRGDEILAREDNPRTVEAELRIQRGRIFDAFGVVLAENEGTPERQSRLYAAPEAAPVVGYYSLRYGTSGVEAVLDSVLRGEVDDPQMEWMRDLLHTAQVGEDVRLSLDLQMQKRLTAVLGEETGAAIVLFLPRGRDDVAQVRGMVSTPSYDPNVLNDEFDLLTQAEDAPLLNRATQAQYQPGEILLPFLWTSALAQGVVDGEATPQTADLVAVWDEAGLTAVWADWGFLSAPNFVLPVAEPDVAFGDVDDLDEAVRGEGALLVTPLQVALATAALVQDGHFPQIRLVTAVGQPDDWRSYDVETPAAQQPITQNAAENGMRIFFLDYLDPAGFYTTSVPSGANKYNHWVIHLSPPDTPQFLLVALIENEQEQDSFPELQTLLSKFEN